LSSLFSPPGRGGRLYQTSFFFGTPFSWFHKLALFPFGFLFSFFPPWNLFLIRCSRSQVFFIQGSSSFFFQSIFYRSTILAQVFRPVNKFFFFFSFLPPPSISGGQAPPPLFPFRLLMKRVFLPFRSSPSLCLVMQARFFFFFFFFFFLNEFPPPPFPPPVLSSLRQALIREPPPSLFPPLD